MTILISCDPNRSTSGCEHRVRQWERKAHRSEGGGTDRGWVAAIVPVAEDGQKKPSTRGWAEDGRGRWFRCPNHSVYWFLATYCESYGSMESRVHSKPQLAFWFSANKNNNRVRLPCIHFMQTKWASDWNTNMKMVVGNNNMTSKQILIYTKTHTLTKEIQTKVSTKICKIVLVNMIFQTPSQKHNL
jgi:hypothetical protein